MFGGLNFKKIKENNLTFDDKNKQFENKLLPFKSNESTFLFPEIWIFEFKNMSWHRPIIGGNYPKKSLLYNLVNISNHNNNKFEVLFFTNGCLKNKCWKLYSSGRLNTEKEILYIDGAMVVDIQENIKENKENIDYSTSNKSKYETATVKHKTSENTMNNMFETANSVNSFIKKKQLKPFFNIHELFQEKVMIMLRIQKQIEIIINN